MVVYDSGLLKLEYDPSTDILFVEFPPTNKIFPTEIGRSYELISEHVRNYDVKNLLIDAGQTQIEISSDELKSVFSKFINDLSTTRVRKIARIGSSNPIREQLAQLLFQEHINQFDYKNFSDKPAAVYWLNEQ